MHIATCPSATPRRCSGAERDPPGSVAGVSQTFSLAVTRQRVKAIHEAGDPPKARRLLAEVIEAARPGYGESHPDVLISAHLLAQLPGPPMIRPPPDGSWRRPSPPAGDDEVTVIR